MAFAPTADSLSYVLHWRQASRLATARAMVPVAVLMGCTFGWGALSIDQGATTPAFGRKEDVELPVGIENLTRALALESQASSSSGAGDSAKFGDTNVLSWSNASVCPAGWADASKKATPVPMYMVGHLRAFAWKVGPWLKQEFCADSHHMYLTTIVTRDMDFMPSEATDEIPVGKTKDAWQEAGRFCDPTQIDIVSDEDLKQELPQRLWPEFTTSGREDPAGGAPAVLQLIANLNQLFLKRAHRLGLQQFREETGSEMNAHQMIIKTRPDSAFDRLWNDLPWHVPKLQAVLNADPNVIFMSAQRERGVSDMAFASSRQVFDRLTAINQTCMLNNSTYLHGTSNVVPEAILACQLITLADVKVHIIEWMLPDRKIPSEWPRAANWSREWDGTCTKDPDVPPLEDYDHRQVGRDLADEWYSPTETHKLHYRSEMRSEMPSWLMQIRAAKLKCDARCA